VLRADRQDVCRCRVGRPVSLELASAAEASVMTYTSKPAESADKADMAKVLSVQSPPALACHGRQPLHYARRVVRSRGQDLKTLLLDQNQHVVGAVEQRWGR
jgi:hypothetical protein